MKKVGFCLFEVELLEGNDFQLIVTDLFEGEDPEDIDEGYLIKVKGAGFDSGRDVCFDSKRFEGMSDVFIVRVVARALVGGGADIQVEEQKGVKGVVFKGLKIVLPYYWPRDPKTGEFEPLENHPACAKIILQQKD